MHHAQREASERCCGRSSTATAASASRRPPPATLHEPVIDSHCHLDLAAFDRAREDVLARAAAAGVVGFFVLVFRPATWDAVRALAGGRVRIALGIHPQIVPDLDPSERALTPEALAQAARDAGALAIGECGLDGATGEREL